ncbi:MAG: hypothetical protein Q9160_001545 [Pyrenula sp. 1 TL-2023]
MGSSEGLLNRVINARLMPYELSNHFWTYVEECLYTHALSVLTPLLTTHVPPTPHIALLHTLCLHPSLTTRTTSSDLHSASNRSHSLLNLILPRHGTQIFVPACRFEQNTHSLRNNRTSKSHSLPTPPPTFPSEHDAPETIPLAHSSSLFHCASDFWHVVGWALNCSILHPLRWRVWLPWLRFMCQLLEDDWHLRDKDAQEQSLIHSYVTSESGVHGSIRRMMRAIFVDGDARAQSEFKEVWKGELKGPKKEDGKPKKREVDVDVDAEVYGDYLGGDDSEDEEEDDEPQIGTTRPQRRKSARNRVKREPGTDETVTPGRKDVSLVTNPPSSRLDANISALHVRLRLLNLLSCVSVRFSSTFTTAHELYTLYVEFIQPLPLPTFQAFVLPGIAANDFSPDAHATLCEYLVYQLIDNDYVTTSEEFLTQKKFELSFLPFAANGSGVVENAKLGLLLESLLRYIARAGELWKSERLVEAIEKGISARAEKAGETSRRKKGSTTGRDEDEAWRTMSESSERIRDLVNRLSTRDLDGMEH